MVRNISAHADAACSGTPGAVRERLAKYHVLGDVEAYHGHKL
eukprot:CAMPEP_0179330742 /NCGR_PEP_ID=MMETSP0797-20121207/63831_1 /TAXON_ID=47934 /ORGANISM="Dinophysis acuminata, Strain DAEP01" /LENGTH=41 /DNA_ID= /DNA_START= /DNA_END= /DNA_ORIENTATION=